MKLLIILFMMLILTSCATKTPTPKNQVTLENKKWEPVNKNINKKDF